LSDGPPPNDRGCRACGKIGHLVRDCPRKKTSDEKKAGNRQQQQRRQQAQPRPQQPTSGKEAKVKGDVFLDKPPPPKVATKFTNHGRREVFAIGKTKNGIQKDSHYSKRAQDGGPSTGAGVHGKGTFFQKKSSAKLSTPRYNKKVADIQTPSSGPTVQRKVPMKEDKPTLSSYQEGTEERGIGQRINSGNVRKLDKKVLTPEEREAVKQKAKAKKQKRARQRQKEAGLSQPPPQN